jgi:hypothetical protein
VAAVFAMGRVSGNAAEKQVVVTPPARHDSVAATAVTVPPPVPANSNAVAHAVARKDSSARKPIVSKTSVRDSLNRMRARRDSLTRLAAAKVPKVIRTPIAAFASAIATGDVLQLRAAYPGMPGKQETAWRDGFFKQAENIKVKAVQYGTAKVIGTTANVDFTVPVDFVFISSKTPSSNNFRYHATLDKQGKAWSITSMTPK